MNPLAKTSLPGSVADFLLSVRRKWRPGTAVEISLGRAFLAMLGARHGEDSQDVTGMQEKLDALGVHFHIQREMLTFLYSQKGAS